MPLTFAYEGAQEMLWEHMTYFHNSTNLQDCQNFLILHVHIGEIIPCHSNIIPYHSYHNIAITIPYTEITIPYLEHRNPCCPCPYTCTSPAEIAPRCGRTIVRQKETETGHLHKKMGEERESRVGTIK